MYKNYKSLTRISTLISHKNSLMGFCFIEAPCFLGAIFRRRLSNKMSTSVLTSFCTIYCKTDSIIFRPAVIAWSLGAECSSKVLLKTLYSRYSVDRSHYWFPALYWITYSCVWWQSIYQAYTTFRQLTSKMGNLG